MADYRDDKWQMLQIQLLTETMKGVYDNMKKYGISSKTEYVRIALNTLDTHLNNLGDEKGSKMLADIKAVEKKKMKA